MLSFCHRIQGLPAGLIPLSIVLLVLGGCSSRSGNPLRISTGYTSHVLCSEVFVSHQDPEHAYAENIGALSSFSMVRWAMHHDVDTDKREVRVRVFGGDESRAVYRDGLGCMNVNSGGPVDAPTPAEWSDADREPALLAEIAGPAPVDPQSPELRAAVDAAFAEPESSSKRFTHGVVIVHDGRIVAERYAPGWTVDTPMQGWSATKSTMNALVGILVREGKLTLDGPAPVAAWQSPGDPRHAITVSNLLHMQSGLDLGESLTAGLSAAWNTASRAMLNEVDLAGFAETATLNDPPGTVWRYANGNSAILARLVRDQVGDHGVDFLRFAHSELFAPLGMRHVTIEMDATGTPIGGAFMLAPARDWARLGLLFLNDGVVGGKRILPEGWVHYSATPVPDAWAGYGAHWWTNAGTGKAAAMRIKWGMPADAFMAVGIFGQWVVVVPSERLVVTRFGTTQDLRMAMEDISYLVRDTIAAIHHSKGRDVSMGPAAPVQDR
jgi:CubicO group peptidase (beta-lactamase class C family)